MDVNLQTELSVRLLAAAVLGGLIGVEREAHEHPAGMRTHLLVAVGCALFTELSIYGFTNGPAGTTAVDPSRLAAQIVTGMGFLGAGAVLKYGTSIRGLTTAASLWATSAIGIGVGTGQYVLAVVGTALVLVSLWPLSRVSRAIRRRGSQAFRVRLVLKRLDTLGPISVVLDQQMVQIEGVQTQRAAVDRYDVELEMRLPPRLSPSQVLSAIDELPDVEILETARSVE